MEQSRLTEVPFCGPNGCGVKQESSDDVFPLTIRNMNLGIKLEIGKAVKKEKKVVKLHLPVPDPLKIVPECKTCGKLLVGSGTKDDPWRYK